MTGGMGGRYVEEKGGETSREKEKGREEESRGEKRREKVIDGRVNGDLGVSRALGDYDRRYGRKVCRGGKGRARREEEREGERRKELLLCTM